MAIYEAVIFWQKLTFLALFGQNFQNLSPYQQNEKTQNRFLPANFDAKMDSLAHFHSRNVSFYIDYD